MPQKCENFTRASPAVNRRRQYSADTPGTARPVPTRGPRPSHPLQSLLARGGRGADLASPKAAGAGCECIQQGAVACTPTAGEPGSAEAKSTSGSSAPHTHSRAGAVASRATGARSCPRTPPIPASGSGAASQQGGHLGAAWAPGLHRPGLPSLLAGHRWVTAPAGTACTRTLAPGIVGVLGVGRGPPGTLGEDWAPSHPNAAPASLPQGTGRHGSSHAGLGPPLCVCTRGARWTPPE